MQAPASVKTSDSRAASKGSSVRFRTIIRVSAQEAPANENPLPAHLNRNQRFALESSLAGDLLR
jgi:hypothetical protein